MRAQSASRLASRWMRPWLWKNASAAAVITGVIMAFATGYFSPDRPTRDEWERLSKASQAPAGKVVYQANFSLETPGQRNNPTGIWGFYNGATTSTVQYVPSGVTLTFGGVPWIGAEFRLLDYEPKAIYRIVIDRVVEGEPAALIVRNRQMDLHRVRIPVGSGPFATEFLAPGGRLDQIVLAFIADGWERPQGTLRISAMRVERLSE